jgi:CheY-like chemotaxis protein
MSHFHPCFSRKASMPDLKVLPGSNNVGQSSHADGSVHVLLIEPEERARSVMHTAFLREGFEVKLASSTEDALHELQSGFRPPSVVLCEADLPGVDGFAFCKQIRSDERTAGLPLILLSGQAEKSHALLASGVGADDYLAMPTYVNDLVALIQLKAGSSASDPVFRSSIERVPLPLMVRALLSGIRSGQIDLQGGGQITFRAGWIVDAKLSSLHGVDALVRMLLASEGDYAVTFGSNPPQTSFELGLQELCTNVFPQIGRWQRAVASSVPLGTRLVPDLLRQGEVFSALPGAVADVARLCDGVRTVRQCVLESPLPEITTLGVLTHLREMGILLPRADSTAADLPLDPLRLSPARGRQPTQPSWFRPAARAVVSVVGVVLISIGAAWVVAQRSGRAGAMEAKPADVQAMRELRMLPDPVFAEPGSEMLERGIRLYNEGKASQAAEVLARAVELHPSASNWLMLGVARLDSGDHRGAQKAAAKSLELDPKNGRAIILRANIYLHTNQREKAAAELKRYLAVEPNGPFAREAAQLLSSW